MKKPRALALLLCACLAALPLGGCLRSQTLDESEYVLAIGFDAGDAFAYRFSFAVQRINAESSEPRAEGFTLLTAEADTLFAAIETVCASLPHELSFARMTMMVFDAALLEREGRLEDLLSAAMEQLSSDPGQPLLNHATQVSLPPGSIMKVITAAAALESGMTPDSPVSGANNTLLPGTSTYLENYAGSTCGGGTTTFMNAFALSCNVPFVEAAPTIGQEKFADVAARFGFDGNPPDIGMPATGSSLGTISDDAQFAMSTIGQSDVRATTLGAAMMAASVSNNGMRMKPQLIRRLQASNLSTVEEMKPEEVGEAVSPEIASTLTDMMKASEAHSGGGIPGVEIASKTGTAEHGEGDSSVPYTWYIAFVPGRDVAVAVCIESGPGITSDTVGATVAGPIGREVLGALLGGGQ